MTLLDPPPAALAAPRERLVTLPDLTGVTAMTDARLIAVHGELAAVRRHLDRLTVTVTAELARRSDRALGQNGLAARLGAASVDEAVQRLTGGTRAEAKVLTTVAAALTQEWLTPVSDSVAGGEVSVAVAAAIATGLGIPTDAVGADELRGTAREVLRDATGSTPEAAARAARHARERLERDRIADVEEHRRSRRSLTWVALPDGMTKLTAVLDPESAAIVTGAIDTVLAPRRGGPRFVGENDIARAAELSSDLRTSAQLALDTLVDIVQLAARAAGSPVDLRSLFGSRSPAVRVHVTAADLASDRGTASIEGQSAAVSAATAARHVCTSGIVPVLFRGTEAIDVGRTHRLHSVRQRIALAAQWGGCAWHGCSRPPAMTEVHHLARWDGSNTTLDNAIPLCRFHHLQLHNGRWRIDVRRSGSATSHWLVPPADHPAARTPTMLTPTRP